jgi:uncharacterized BrkB/YihY/UPF0761 family membrane protein
MTMLRIAYLALSLGLIVVGLSCFASVPAERPRWWRWAQWGGLAIGLAAAAVGVVMASLLERPLWLPR